MMTKKQQLEMIQERHRRLLNLYHKTKGKATIINGHGVLVPRISTVPKDIAIMFLAKDGACMDIHTSIGFQNKFLTSRAGINNLVQTGGRGMTPGNQFHHAVNIHNRTYLPGNKYVDMNILLEPDKKYKPMGYMKKLPTKKSNQNVLIGNLANKRFVNGDFTLSSILKRKRGLFVISACRSNSTNKRSITNYPKNTYPNNVQKRASRGTNIQKLIQTIPIKGALPGIRWSELKGTLAKTNYKRNPSESKWKNIIKMSKIYLRKKGERPESIKSQRANVSFMFPKHVERLKKIASSTPNVHEHRSGFRR